MPFFVYGQDVPGAGPRLVEINETHQRYMDRFADRLILRGPTLSDDGKEHTGSVHVVDLPDRAEAERFASEEPFHSAGLYQHVTTVRTAVLLRREITRDAPHSLVTAQWPPNLHDQSRQLPTADQEDALRFVALLVDDDQSHTTGIVAVVRAHPDEAAKALRPFADHLAPAAATLTTQRWRRGGRP